MQEKVKYIQDVQNRHKSEIIQFEQFCDYLEPGSFQEKLRLQIRQLHTQESLLHKPVKDLERQRDMLTALRDRKVEELDDVEKKNERLRERISKEQALREEENEKNVVYLSDQQKKVISMRSKIKTIKDKMLELDKNTINIGRNPAKAISKVS